MASSSTVNRKSISYSSLTILQNKLNYKILMISMYTCHEMHSKTICMPVRLVPQCAGNSSLW